MLYTVRERERGRERERERERETNIEEWEEWAKAQNSHVEGKLVPNQYFHFELILN
jgi:hypothetical protein